MAEQQNQMAMILVLEFLMDKEQISTLLDQVERGRPAGEALGEVVYTALRQMRAAAKSSGQTFAPEEMADVAERIVMAMATFLSQLGFVSEPPDQIARQAIQTIQQQGRGAPPAGQEPGAAAPPAGQGLLANMGAA